MYTYIGVPTCGVQIIDTTGNAFLTEVTACSDTAASKHSPFCVSPPPPPPPPPPSEGWGGISNYPLHPNGEVVSPSIQYFAQVYELHAIILSQKPDLLCVVETWLCEDIEDNELLLLGYQLYRLDHNRHGGGLNLCAYVVRSPARFF